jgi:NADPH-dependent 2,4-dienoyl-CoA reductase/sulfur reductase-like enzyme
LNTTEIEEVIKDFAQAARRAKEAGLDAVELHAAHAFGLVGSFLSSSSNKRTDAYGGPLEGRLRFLLDVLRGMRKEVGPDFPIIARISGNDRVPEGRSSLETQYIAPCIAEAGADAIEVSGGTVPEAFWGVVPPAGTPLAINADSAEAVKKVVQIPVICVGRIKNPRLADFLIATGRTDMVSMGRALIADPELPKKASEGNFDDIAPCIADNQGCFGSGAVRKPMSCFVNSMVGREKDWAIVPAETPRKVMVVGGGPSGLEAARVAALRGHQVTLYEKEAKLGGQVNLACIPPFKHEMSLLIKYLSHQIARAGVEVILGEEVGPELVDEKQPDVVILATGGTPSVPEEIPDTSGKRVVTAWDVLAGKAALNAKSVVVVGGGSVGCETADFLAESGDNLVTGRTRVTIIEMLEDIGMDMAPQTRHLLMQRLRGKGVRFITSAQVRAVLDDGVTYVKNDREQTIDSIDYVVLALGTKALETLSGKLGRKNMEVHVIGDARDPGNLMGAIHQGSEIGRMI